jgi:NADPH-dependent glutamate synthase beta subunit-like oxidoreductase
MNDQIPAPIRLALEGVIKQYDTTHDTNQLVEDICDICVVTETNELPENLKTLLIGGDMEKAMQRTMDMEEVE